MQTAADGQWMEGPLREELPRDTQDGASARGRTGSQSQRSLMVKGHPQVLDTVPGFSTKKSPSVAEQLFVLIGGSGHLWATGEETDREEKIQSWDSESAHTLLPPTSSKAEEQTPESPILV